MNREKNSDKTVASKIDISAMFNKIKPHLIAAFIFFVVSAVYFAPQYKGEAVRQYDNVQANGTRASIDRAIEQYGEHPNWIDNMFGGMPSYTFSMESMAKKVTDPVGSLLHLIQQPASYYFLLMIGFYFMAICFGVSPLVAIVGSLAWGLSTYFYIIYTAGHVMKLVAMTYISPLIGSIYLAYKRDLLLGGSLAALFTILEVRSVHPQITYYFLFVIFALIVGVGVAYYKKKALRGFFIKSVALLGFALLGVGANSVYLYYTMDYTKESSRGKPILESNSANKSGGLDKDYITAWSYGKAETINLLVPNAFGGTSEGGFQEDGELYEALKPYDATHLTGQLPAYWGPQPMTSGPVYIGAVIVFLFIVSLFLVRGTLFTSMIVVSLLALFLAWGENMMWFTDMFIDYFPLYNKFRTVSMILVVVQFTIPLLAMLALQKLLDKGVEIKQRVGALRNSAILVGGFLVVLIIFAETLFSFASPRDSGYGLPSEILQAMQFDRISLMQADAFRSFALIIATAAIIYYIIKKPKYKTVGVFVIAALVVLDMVPINKRFLNNDDFIPEQQAGEILMTDIDREILKDKSNYRVANFTVSTFNDALTSKYHRSVGGYSAVKPRRYQDLIDYYLSKQDINIYSLLNTKYFIVPDGDKGDKKVVLNNQALGNAWFVSGIDWVKTPNQEIERIGKVNLSKVAVVSTEFKSELEDKISIPKEGDYIKQTGYRPNMWDFEYSVEDNRFAVLSEMYFPNGWSATANGKELKLFRVNYDFFGMIVPKGSGTIHFEFNPPMFAYIDIFATICAVVTMLLVFLALVLSYRKRAVSPTEII